MSLGVTFAYMFLLVLANILLANILLRMSNKRPTIKQALRSVVTPSGIFSVKSKRKPIANDDEKAYFAEAKDSYPQTPGREG